MTRALPLELFADFVCVCVRAAHVRAGPRPDANNQDPPARDGARLLHLLGRRWCARLAMVEAARNHTQ